jgi:hypothetical protein
MSISTAWDIDAIVIYNYISSHADRDDIIALYMKGPPRRDGFLHWKATIINDDIKPFMCRLGYDGTAFSLMQAKVQSIIRKKHQI